MLFKNLTAYRFSDQWTISLGDLEAAVAQRPARECQAQETEHFGFDYVHDKTRLRVWPLHNEQVFFIRITHHKRLLPSAVVKSEARKVIEKREKETDTPLKAVEKREITEQVRDQLLQKAFQKRSFIQLIVHLKDQEIWIDQTAEKKCESSLSLLRKVVGSLPVRPISEDGEIAQHLNVWLLNAEECPADIELGDAALLVDTSDDKARVSIKREDLTSNEIQALLDHRDVISLGVEIGGQFVAQLTKDQILKSIKPTDAGKAPPEEDPDAAFDAEAYLSVMDIQMARTKLKQWLGSEHTLEAVGA